MRVIRRDDPPHAGNPDEQYIERVRGKIATFDRWRGFLVYFQLLITLVFIVAFVALVVLMQSIGRFLGQMGLGINPGFLLGVSLGIGLGIGVIHLVHGLYVLTSGLRNERLLIRCYDSYRELREQVAQDPREDADLVYFGED
jgi:hypothetical protein